MAAAARDHGVVNRAFPLALLSLAVAVGPAHAATSVKRYVPWTPVGEPTTARYFHGSGECLQASRVSSRADAWRCVSGTIALDPCFLSPTDDEVLCVRSPWARRGHLLSAVIDPDTHGSSPAPDAWALRVGRRRCTYIAGRPRRSGPTYRCGKRGFLFGRPNRRKATWTIRAARARQGRNTRRVRIRAAWT